MVDRHFIDRVVAGSEFRPEFKAATGDEKDPDLKQEFINYFSRLPRNQRILDVLILTKAQLAYYIQAESLNDGFLSSLQIRTNPFRSDRTRLEGIVARLPYFEYFSQSGVEVLDDMFICPKDMFSKRDKRPFFGLSKNLRTQIIKNSVFSTLKKDFGEGFGDMLDLSHIDDIELLESMIGVAFKEDEE